MERDGEGGLEKYNQEVKESMDKLVTWKWKLFSKEPIAYWSLNYGTTVRYPWLRTIRTGLGEGIMMPRRFGLAYYDFNTNTKHYVIYPFNFIVAIIRRLYFATRFEIPYEFLNYERKWRKNHGK